MRALFALAFVICAALSPAAAQVRCSIVDEEHIRHIAARLNVTRGPRLVEAGVAHRSLNELVRSVTDDNQEHSTIWWGELGEENGGGILVLGSEGEGGCHVLQVPAQQWPMVLRVILGTAV